MVKITNIALKKLQNKQKINAIFAKTQNFTCYFFNMYL